MPPSSTQVALLLAACCSEVPTQLHCQSRDTPSICLHARAHTRDDTSRTNAVRSFYTHVVLDRLLQTVCHFFNIAYGRVKLTGLSPAHVPHRRVNNPTRGDFCDTTTEFVGKNLTYDNSFRCTFRRYYTRATTILQTFPKTCHPQESQHRRTKQQRRYTINTCSFSPAQQRPGEGGNVKQ